MERNELLTNSNQGRPDGSNPGASLEATGTTDPGATSTESGASTADTDFADRARNIAGTAEDKLADIAETAQEKLADVGSTARERGAQLKDKLSNVGSTVRDRSGQAKASLADALETGANKLRDRTNGSSGSPNLAGATEGGSVAVENEGRLTEVGNKVASGMDATAGWLRDTDLDGLKTSLESQVKEHPGRTLLVAAGLGYLLGKALRK